MLFFIQNMSRSLVVDNNPQVVTENASIEDIDINHVVFNVALNHEEAANTINTFTGNIVQLSTDKGRSWRREAWNFLVICWNPAIILTLFSNALKQRLCNYFSAHGHVVLPSGEQADHLIRGWNKPVPTMVLLAALIDSGVDFV
jgi:hypothetical protein